MNFHPSLFDFLVVSGTVFALSIWLAFMVNRLDTYLCRPKVTPMRWQPGGKQVVARKRAF